MVLVLVMGKKESVKNQHCLVIGGSFALALYVDTGT